MHINRKSIFLLLLFFSLSLGKICAQRYVFFPSKADFNVYDLQQEAVIKNFEYSQSNIRGVLWRPTADLGYIYYKTMPDNSEILRVRTSSGMIEKFNFPEPFVDFQIIDANLLVIRTKQSLYLWKLGSLSYQLLLKDFSGIYFHYDTSRKLLITQDLANMLTLHTSDGVESTQYLDRTSSDTFFTYSAGRLTYLTTSDTWVTYNVDTQAISQTTLEHDYDVVAVWPLRNGNFFIQQCLSAPIGRNPGVRFILYKPAQNKYVQEVLREEPNIEEEGGRLLTASLVALLSGFPGYLKM